MKLAGPPAVTHAPRGPSDSEVLAALRSYAREVGAPPTIRGWSAQRRRPGVKLICTRFGSWGAALDHAGISRRLAEPWAGTSVVLPVCDSRLVLLHRLLGDC